MKTMRCAPVFRYQFRDLLLGFAPFFGIVVVIIAASIIGARLHSGVDVIGFSGFGMMSAICLFVLGVVSPRPNLRLCIQLGVSRRTAFLSQLMAVALGIVVLAAAGELLFAVAQPIASGSGEFFMKDLYQMLYLDESVVTLTAGEHLMSLCFNSAMLLAAFAFGMFFTFLFWRLSRFWIVVAAVSIPLTLNLVPMLIGRVCGDAVVELFTDSAWNVMAAMLLFAALFILISWRLMSRANIREPQSK